MREVSSLNQLSLIDLSLMDRLRDPDFRREWFRAELEDDVPAAFRALRERRDLTQADLAKLMGTKQPAISRFEKSSDAVWELDFLLRMTEALDARLRLVVEASEDIINELDDLTLEIPTQPVPAVKLASVISQTQPTPFAQQNTNSGIADETREHRAIESHRLGELSIYQGQPFSFRFAGGSKEAVQLSSAGR